jgi:hypothetical protein
MLEFEAHLTVGARQIQGIGCLTIWSKTRVFSLVGFGYKVLPLLHFMTQCSFSRLQQDIAEIILIHCTRI